MKHEMTPEENEFMIQVTKEIVKLNMNDFISSAAMAGGFATNCIDYKYIAEQVMKVDYQLILPIDTVTEP